MRMTNEQFQAEVFRRSKAYMQQRQVRRRRLRRGALVFAGCLVVAIGGEMPRIAQNLRGIHNSADMATAEQQNNGNFFLNGEDGAKEAACEGPEASFALDAADEAYDGDENGTAPVMQDAHQSGITGTEKKPASAVAVKSDGEESEAYSEEADTEYADAADLLAMLGVAAMPEQLGGCALDSGSAEGVYLYSDGDRWIEVRLSLPTAQESDENTPDGERAEECILRGVWVRIYAVGCTHSQFETAAKELHAYLEQEGS